MLRAALPVGRRYLFSPNTYGARTIVTVAGEFVDPVGHTALPVIATDMNFSLNSYHDLEQLERASVHLPKDRFVALNYKSYIDPEFETGLVWSVHGMLTDILRRDLRRRREALTLELIAREKLQSQTKTFLISAFGDEPMPRGVDGLICVEALDYMQKVLAETGGFFQTRIDAMRDYPDSLQRSHPTNPMGVYLAADPGSIVLLNAGLPINSGTSGTSSNVMNALYNLTGNRLHEDQIPMLASILHGYLAGPRLIDILTPAIEEGVRSATSQHQYSSLVRTGLGQTHTQGEVINALLLTDAAQKKGDELSGAETKAVLRNGVEMARRALNE